jgi:AcrR family transcriptional regulator
VGSGTRVRLDREERRAQLVQLGLEMLSTRSLDRLAIEDIARAAGISRGLLFHYFPSKRDFHVAVVRAAADDMLAHTATDPGLSVRDQLRQALEAFVDYVSTSPDAYVALVRGAAGADPGLRAVFEDTRSTIAHRLLANLGDAPSPRLRLAVRGWIAFAEEVTLEWLSGATPEMDRADLVDLLDDALVALVQTAAGGPAAPSSAASGG